MDRVDGFIAGFEIFTNHGHKDFDAQHDVVYAGGDPAEYSEEEIKRLEELGWRVDEEYDCFHFFT